MANQFATEVPELEFSPAEILSFLLENKQAVVSQLSFAVSRFIGPAGTDPFQVPVEFEPPQLTLQPEEVKPVELRLQLDPAHIRHLHVQNQTSRFQQR